MSTEDPALARLLRRHRATLGLTQEELAERAGISTRTISDIERGLRSAVYRDTADRLADALELTDADREELHRVGRARRAPRFRITEERSGIPRPRTPIIGRESEIATVAAALRSREAGIVVLTGPGGIGKTRLAVEVAGLLEQEFSDGAAFVELAGVGDPQLLPVALADALAIPQLREPLAAAIAAHLRDRELLLVLDTFEHLVDGAPLVAELSAACLTLTTLVTSRTPLRVLAEHEFPLGPLTLAEGAETPSARDVSAVALFTERARAVRPDLELGSEAARRELAAICRRLDGIPLAIELAAARVRHLPLNGLREALDAPLDVLTGGPRDVPDRQRSMREAVAWSYELLARGDQRLLRALSTFAGGWTQEAAAFVTSADPPSEVFVGISRLIDHSLVVADASADTARYGMFDVIREFAAERRDAAGETEALALRHAESCVGLAEAEEPRLRGRDQTDAARRLAAESDNLRQALRWCLSRGEAELALRLAGALWQFWRLRGDLVEGRAWLEEALGLPHPTDQVRGKAMWGAGWLALHQGEIDRCETYGTELRDAADTAGDALGRRNGLTILAKAATARGRHAEAVALCEAAVESCRHLDPSWHLATSVFNLATAVLLDGDLSRADALFTEAIERYRALGDEIFSSRATGYLGYPALLRGDTASAREHMLRSLEGFLAIDDAWGIAEALERLSALEAASGRPERAAEIAGAAERLRETVFIEPMREETAIIEPYLREARSELGDDAWHRAVERGRDLTADGVRASLVDDGMK